MSKKKPTLSRPKDRSLQAFKAWVLEIADRMGVKNGRDLTDDQWAARHKAFWAKAGK